MYDCVNLKMKILLALRSDDSYTFTAVIYYFLGVCWLDK